MHGFFSQITAYTGIKSVSTCTGNLKNNLLYQNGMHKHRISTIIEYTEIFQSLAS